MGIVERLNKASAHASRARDSNAIDEAVAFIERVGKVMDEVQWNSYDEGYSCCPCCDRRRSYPRLDRDAPIGHAPDCELAACLREIKD
jgi:hypothetical protein